jgi:hypothetical protein
MRIHEKRNPNVMRELLEGYLPIKQRISEDL